MSIIDFFYKPFARFVSPQFFRYGFAGGANLCLDWIIFFVFYHYIFKEQVVHVGALSFTPYIASFIVSFVITFCTGFWLSRYISFHTSTLHRGVQLYRYLLVVVICILITYFGLKLLVGVFNFYPTPSKMFLTVVTTFFSYFSQKYFTFRA